MQIKKILVPLDGSEPARHVLAYVIYLADISPELGQLNVVDLNHHAPCQVTVIK